MSTDRNSWPRNAGDRSVHKVYDHSGVARNTWFVSSLSQPGCFRQVQFCGNPRERWFTCTCPAGHWGERRMGSRFDRPCAHVRAVTQAEVADTTAVPSQVVPTNVSALVD